MASGEPFEPRAPRLFLDDPEAVSEGLITIRGSAVHRLTRVMRMRRSDALEVIHEPSGRVYRTELARLGAEAIEATIVRSRPIAPERGAAVTLCPAIIRAPRFDMVVEKATELGVCGFRPVRATRSLAQSQGRERMARWKRLVTEAAEQCRREQRPWIEPPVEIEELVAQAPAAGTLRLFASEREAGRHVGDVIPAGAAPAQVEILVGPEGGFTAAEADAAIGHGWRSVSLGDHPLRAETAAIVATALVFEALRRGS